MQWKQCYAEGGFLSHINLAPEFGEHAIPLNEAVKAALQAWRNESRFTEPDHHVFAGRGGNLL